MLHLAHALADGGDAVAIAGAGTPDPPHARVAFLPPGATPAADVTIALNDARLLPTGARTPIVWFHNEVTLWREARRGRLPALRRQRPIGVFLGAAHAGAASGWLPLRRRVIVPHGVAAAFAATSVRPAPPPVALFTSQAYRGLGPLLRLWRDRIGPAVPAARFEALIVEADQAAHAAVARQPGVVLAPRLANAAMPARLAAARVLLAPGHASETFCLAAAEAIAAGVPVITRGWGALAERVRDGETGFVCRTWRSYAEATIAALTDDALWRRLHAGCLAQRQPGWGDVAPLWRDLL